MKNLWVMQRKIVFFFTVCQGELKLPKKYFLANNQKFGYKHLTECMCKNLSYFIALEN